MADVYDSINSCLLFYGIKTSDRPFAASLIGIHTNRQAQEDLQSSNDFTFATFEHVRTEKPPSTPSCDPSFYSSRSSPTPLPRAHRSWLPPLKFQPPLESEHPALQPSADQSILSRTQTPLLPTSVDQNTLPYRQRSKTFSNSSLDQGNALATASSSVYSRSTSISEVCHNPSTLSYFSNGSYDGPARSDSLNPQSQSPKPTVPAIPARYRHPSHSLRNGGQPLRPGSRPALPPAGFWVYASNEKQKQTDVLDGRRMSIWPDARPVRPRAGSSISPTETKRPCYSLVPPPERAILRPNMSRGNTMRVAKRSYESVRKQSISDIGFDFELDVDTSPSKTRESRTLVKKRQPWDQEPRQGRRVS